MSNKVRSITIVFDQDVTEEYIDFIEKTALCYKHVLKVDRDVADPETWASEIRIKGEVRDKLYKVIKDLF
jgi:hypothetical protein